MSLTDSNFLSLRMRTLTNFEQERTCSRMHDISARRVLLGIKIVWYLDTTNPSTTNTLVRRLIFLSQLGIPFSQNFPEKRWLES